LEEGWSDLFLLSVYQWSMPMDSCPLLAGCGQSMFNNGGDNGDSSTPVVHVKPSDIRYLHDLFLRLRTYQVDQGEYACLKALVLFRPGKHY